MQVYIAICNAQEDYIVAKKREFNSLWDRKISLAGPLLVNQTGQWTLPGGKYGAGSHGIDA